MQIKARYSHLNGEEYLLVHHRQLWEEVQSVIAEVDAFACRTKVSEEKNRQGELLFSPKDLNKAFRDGFRELGWTQRRSSTFWVTHDDKLMRRIHNLPGNEQKQEIQEAGYEPLDSYNQTDFVKDRIAVEVQFGKYAFVAHGLFVKHLSFYAQDIDRRWNRDSTHERTGTGNVIRRPLLRARSAQCLAARTRCSGSPTGADRSRSVTSCYLS